MPSVLILNPADGTGLNFSRSLAEAGGYSTVGLVGTLDEYHSCEVDRKHLIPWTSDDGLVNIINDCVARYGIDIVYAADTGAELDVVSSRRGDINAVTFLPAWQDHRLMEDKWATWLSLSRAGLPVPDTVLVSRREDLQAIFERTSDVWLRRRAGSAGAGSIPTQSLDFACAWVDEQDGWGDFTAATRLTPRTATFSGLWWEGQLVASQLRERLGWRHGYLSASGVTGITACQRTIWDEALHDQAVACVRATSASPHGAIGVDFTYDECGQAVCTEVQPARFYSSVYFLARCGLNFPHLYCELALGNSELAKDPRVNPIRETRYWIKAVDRLPQLLRHDEYEAGF